MEVTVEQVGDFRVTVQRKSGTSPWLPALVTIHDIGLNSQSCMDFLEAEYNVQLFDKFAVYHIEVPGQHKDAERFPEDYRFLGLPKMADKMIAILERYHLKDVIGFGVGAGAYLMIHLAMAVPNKFLGITVFDPAGKSLGLKEWSEQKLAAWQLEKKGFNSRIEKLLKWHLLGKRSTNKTKELTNTTMADLDNHQNAFNLSQYMNAFVNRTSIIPMMKKKLQCNILIITSKNSPYKRGAEQMYTSLNKTKSSLLVCDTDINAFFEDPGKCGEAMLLFIQGVGLAPTLKTRTAIRAECVRRSTDFVPQEAG